MRDDFSSTVCLRKRLRFHFGSPDADDFAGVNPMRILYNISVPAKNLRPPERILQVKVGEIPERIALFDDVFDFLCSIGDHELVGRIGADAISGGSDLGAGAWGRENEQRSTEDRDANP